MSKDNKTAHVCEPGKRIPVVRDVDVVVAGAGCAGVFAALAAAKYGAKTLLIDRLGSLGGNVGPGMIYGCVDPFEGAIHLPTGLQGLVRQFSDRATALRGSLPSLQPVYSNIFAYLAAKMMEESGVELMLSAYASDPILENGVVQGLFVETKSGRVAVRSRTVIDDTAEADIAMRAGAPMIRHVKPDGIYPVFKKCWVQELYANWNEVGLVFLAAGVDWEKYDAFTRGGEAIAATGFPHVEPNGIVDNQLCNEVVPIVKYPSKLMPFLRAAWDKGEYRFARDVAPHAGICWQANMLDERGFARIGQDGAEGFTIIYGDIDTDDWSHVSLCETELRKHAFETVAFMRRYAPGWEQAFVTFTNPFAGARGGACIHGEYLITPDDILKGARHPDVVLRNQWEAKTWKKVYEHKNATALTREGYDMPYRMMLPRGLDGLLVVGRGSSYIRRGHDPATRARITQFHLGQVAGTAAAFCAQDGVTVRQCNVKKLQTELLSQGFFLGEENRLKELGLPDDRGQPLING